MSGQVQIDHPEFLEFWTQRHLCSLTTLRADGSPHVVAVGATLDPSAGLARVISARTSAHVRHISAGAARVALCQLDGARWSTISGLAVIRTDPAAITEGEKRYSTRYRVPRPNPGRVVIEIAITEILGSSRFTSAQ